LNSAVLPQLGTPTSAMLSGFTVASMSALKGRPGLRPMPAVQRA
jgi:hypothetical protein